MNFTIPPLDHLVTESDVEQKLVFPLLTSIQPYGLGLNPRDLLTKTNIRRFPIGKGNDRKIYFPDYLYVEAGFPLAVVEVKKPGEDLAEAYREARLYASELNANYPSGLNPLRKVMATDGARLFAGIWDEAYPVVDMELSELIPTAEKMGQLNELMGRQSLQHDFQQISRLLKPHRFFKPRRMVGGESVQREEIGSNTFGASLAAEFVHIFNPSSMEDRRRIATEAYIPSRRRERFVDPIDKVIRASRPALELNSSEIADTSNPTELMNKLRKQKPLEHQVLLIVGSVGSGKSTFVDHLQYAALPRDIIETTLWIRVNMNNAPVASSQIYEWLRSEIIAGCRAAYPSIDFDELENLRSVFSVELRQFEKGVGRLYKETPDVYSVKLAEHLESVLKDSHKQAVAYTRHCSSERGKLLILVIDNCDKRTRDQQLIMFDAAQWIQKEFRALVILPIREETYDNYRDQPPLDTALKDLVFRIEPPLFNNVLTARVQLALNEIKNLGEKTYRYELPNGFHVQYTSSDKAAYLSSILSAVFKYDKQVRRLILGLAARNIRRALEIFLEFCSSGHISEEHILKIWQSEGQYLLPLPLVVRVLLRTNRRFYDSDRSYIKNLFAIDAKDARPNYLTRLLILSWLIKYFAQLGPSGQKGYFPAGMLCEKLSIYGIEEAVILRELEYLVKGLCVITEDFKTEGIGYQDLVKLGPAGFVHLELLGTTDYLAAIAEDTWFPDQAIATAVVERIRLLEKHYTPQNAIDNARAVLSLMDETRARDMLSAGALLQDSHYAELSDLDALRRGINDYESSLTSKPWQGVRTRFPLNVDARGIVVNVTRHGVFVEMEPGVTGLIPASMLPFLLKKDPLRVDDAVTVRPSNIDALARKMTLVFVKLETSEPSL